MLSFIIDEQLGLGLSKKNWIGFGPNILVSISPDSNVKAVVYVQSSKSGRKEKVRNSESNTAPKLAKMPSKKKRRRPESERPTIHPRNKYSETRPDFALLASLYPSFEPFVFYSHDGGRPRIDWTDFNATRELTRVLLLHDHALNWYYFTCSFLLYMHLGAHISLKVCVFLWENWVCVSMCFCFGRVFMLELEIFLLYMLLGAQISLKVCVFCLRELSLCFWVFLLWLVFYVRIGKKKKFVDNSEVWLRKEP